MLPYRHNTIGVMVLGVFFVALLGYALFELRGAFIGPSISIETKEVFVHDPYVVIQGKAERITVLTLNGATIPVTESGVFKEPVLLAPGYNVVDIEASDASHRTAKKRLTIVYEPLAATTTPSAIMEATNTPPTQAPETSPEQTVSGEATTSIETTPTPVVH